MKYLSQWPSSKLSLTSLLGLRPYSNLVTLFAAKPVSVISSMLYWWYSYLKMHDFVLFTYFTISKNNMPYIRIYSISYQALSKWVTLDIVII